MKGEDTYVYVDNCAGCDHWRDYKWIGDFRDWWIYRCPVCGIVKFVEKGSEEIKEYG